MQKILMISTSRIASGLIKRAQASFSWTSGNPYNVRWQYKWKPAYYTYLRDGFEPKNVPKPEDTPAVSAPFYTYYQDFLYRTFPSLKNIYQKSWRFQDPFQIYVLPSISLFFYQFWDLAAGFKAFAIMPWVLFWTRVRDRSVDPDINQIHLRDIIHENPQIGALFQPESIHLLDYEFTWDKGISDEAKFPEFKNSFFRFFNTDSHMTTGLLKFGDLESGATMNLHVKTMPVAGRFRYQVGEPYYFYDVRAEVHHQGKYKEIVLIDQADVLQRKRPFLMII